MEMNGEQAQPVDPRSAYAELGLISFVILFLELACIRWFGSMVVFLSFFTNIVLMACFLGMSVGCLAASRRVELVRLVMPIMLVSIFLSSAVFGVSQLFGRVVGNVGSAGSPQEIFFGAEYKAKDPSSFIVPIEAVAGLFFVLIALVFVGLGQVLGRALNAIPSRVAAYTVNILGSLAGIVAFAEASYLHTPPLLWFAIGLGLCLVFLRPWTPLQIFTHTGILLVLGMVAYLEGRQVRTIWSPYYKIYYNAKDRTLITNNIGHQEMVASDEKGLAYRLVHLLNRDAGRPPFEDVLIIGAGSGNDVQGALSQGSQHIDAVEIEPVLNEIGRADHPDRPYDSPRVSIHVDDGRSFLKKTDREYDLIAYALVDSLVLHSGYSSLRLESFLFTEQAFRDIDRRLKPDGVFAVYNFYRQGWVVDRLVKMARQAFGSEPLVISLPYQARITPGSQYGAFTLILVGKPDSAAIRAIRRQFERGNFFWANDRPRLNEPVNGFGPQPPQGSAGRADHWQRIGPATVEPVANNPVPTDDWPFLYLREPEIPVLNLRGIGMIAVLSLAVLFSFAPVRTVRPNGLMFFLGAGFMLLETRAVVHMALLFGSTWVVNSIVFFAILVMILVGNLYVLWFRPRALWPYYGLLIAALLLNAYVPMSAFLALPGAMKTIASCALVFVPVFFAGVIFAAAFRDSRQPDVDFGSNIGGVILGGLSENVSLVVGFNHLLLLAIAYYILSAVLRPRRGALAQPV